jgi:hypothetical protein
MHRAPTTPVAAAPFSKHSSPAQLLIQAASGLPPSIAHSQTPAAQMLGGCCHHTHSLLHSFLASQNCIAKPLQPPLSSFLDAGNAPAPKAEHAQMGRRLTAASPPRPEVQVAYWPRSTCKEERHTSSTPQEDSPHAFWRNRGAAASSPSI